MFLKDSDKPKKNKSKDKTKSGHEVKKIHITHIFLYMWQQTFFVNWQILIRQNF